MQLRINGKRISFDDKFTKKNTGVCDVTINVAVPTLPGKTAIFHVSMFYYQQIHSAGRFQSQLTILG